MSIKEQIAIQQRFAIIEDQLRLQDAEFSEAITKLKNEIMALKMRVAVLGKKDPKAPEPSFNQRLLDREAAVDLRPSKMEADMNG